MILGSQRFVIEAVMADSSYIVAITRGDVPGAISQRNVLVFKNKEDMRQWFADLAEEVKWQQQ